MSKLFQVLLIGLAASVVAGRGYAARDAVWDSEQQLTNSDYDEYTDAAGQRNVAVDPQGRIHIVWYVENYLLSNPFQIFYKRYNPGSGWTQDTCLTPDLMERNIYNRFPSIAVDVQGNLQLVWCGGPTSRALSTLYYKRCTPAGPGNGGWQDTAVSIGPGAADDSVYTPDVACSPNGHVHVVWGRVSTSFTGIRYRESSDGGNTWLSEISIFDTARAVACPQNNPTVACAANNSVHIAWSGKDYFGGAFHLYYRKRIGSTWFAREGVVMSSADQYLPSIAISPLTGNPHIIWRRWFGLDSLQIVYTYWDNVWQTVQVISGSPADTFQMNPQLAFTPDGSAHAVWRGRSVSSPSLVQVRYAARSPAGVWTSPTDLSAGTLRTRDYPSIAAAGHDLHAVWQDDRGTYQNIYYRHGLASFHDVGCRLILTPQGLVDSGSVIAPACSLQNYDTTSESYMVRLKIGSGYNQTASVTNHLPGTRVLVTFPEWTALPRGLFAVTCSTELGTDADHTNDKAVGSVSVTVHDVGCTRIGAPSGTIDTLTVVTPACSVYNYGNATESYDVRLKVGSFYDQTAPVIAQGPGTRVYVTFPAHTNWPRGASAVTCSTELAGDLAPTNDRQTGSVTSRVVDMALTAILRPLSIEGPGSIPVTARVRNSGGDSSDCRVRVTITDSAGGEVYNQFLDLPVSAPDDSVLAQLPDWAVAVEGAYHVRALVTATGDFNPDNDSLVRDVLVTSTGIAEPKTSVPLSFAFVGARPNPFGERTVLRYSLPAETRVNLRVYSMAGKFLRLLQASVQPAGYHVVNWDGRDEQGRLLGRGIYFCRLTAGNQTSIQKVMIVR